jgi:beta-glucosidase-like glycosyl hydrolase
MNSRRLNLGVFFGLLPLVFAACSNPSETIKLTPNPPDAPASEEYLGAQSVLSPPSEQAGTVTIVSSRLSRLFLVEQPSARYSKQIGEAFRKDPPGGLVFWNSGKVGAKELSETVERYSRILKNNGHLPALFSIDYEGGGLRLSPSGAEISGIQRFREGFSDLAHGVWLGQSMGKYGTELCRLHGRIIGKELAIAGINYPLTLVGDLASRLFTLRGVSTDPLEVAKCVSDFTMAMAEAGPVIAVTKHYPGLGQNSGDTHDVVSISTAKSESEAERHLFPFRETIKFVNRNGLQTRFSIMASHGKFPVYDSVNLTTESSKLLESMLRDELGFKGIRLSDAMWMGGYGDLSGDALYAVYLNAFTSGMDMLMIPGNRYGGALNAFEAVYIGRASEALKSAIEDRAKQPYAIFVDRFKKRVSESLERIDRTLKSLPYSHDVIQTIEPKQVTIRERSRYYEILRSMDGRWEKYVEVKPLR